MTLAPWSTAKVMPAAMSSSLAEPCESRTLTGMILPRQAPPDTPCPLLVMAAAMPATIVPWPKSSSGVGSLLTKSHPGTSRPARSGWLSCTPESMMARIIESLPVVVSQAAGRCISCR